MNPHVSSTAFPASPALSSRYKGYNACLAYKFASFLSACNNERIDETMADGSQPPMNVEYCNDMKVVRFEDGSAVSFGYHTHPYAVPSLLPHLDGDVTRYPANVDVLTFPTFFHGLMKRLAQAFEQVIDTDSSQPNNVWFESFVGNDDESVTVTFRGNAFDGEYSLTIAPTESEFAFESAVTDFGLFYARLHDASLLPVDVIDEQTRLVINPLPTLRFRDQHHWGWLLYRMAGTTAVVVEYCAGQLTANAQPIEKTLTDTIRKQRNDISLTVLVLDECRYDCR